MRRAGDAVTARWLAGLGTAAMLPYFLLPNQIVAGVYRDVCLVSMIVVAARAVRRRRADTAPWMLLLAGQACFVVGYVAWMVIHHIVRSAATGPNVADVFYVAGYAPIGLGLVLLARRQRRPLDLAATIDALTVAIGIGVLLWVTVIGPAALDPSVGVGQRLVNTGYPAGDLVLIAIGAQLAVRVQRSLASWWLGTALALQLAADIWYAVLMIDGSYVDGHVVDMLWWLSHVAVASLATHPVANHLSRPAAAPVARFSGYRLLAVFIVVMAAPLTIAWRAATDRPLELPALLGGTIAMFALVVTRLVVLARQLDASRARAVHDATHDALTGLGNRVLYGERVRAVLAPDSVMPERVAVLCLDLDDFKAVNDNLGHAVGDRLLQVVGERLRSVVRRHDSVARLSGDEFAILIEDQPAEAAIDVAERALAVIAEPVDLPNGTFVRTTASIGIAYGAPGTSVDALMRDADLAMYAAKTGGKSRWEVFRPGMHKKSLDHLELRAELAGALEREELTLHYQPIVDVATGAVSGFEALLRWEHPERGRIEPGRFVALAEQAGLIVPIGAWVLAEACRQVMRIDADAGGPFISVNISPVQLRSSSLVDEVEQALLGSGLTPSRLLVELTESAVIEDYAAAADRLTTLRRLGVRVALDDFGAGYTSLRHLQSLPLDVVKLDRSFVAGLDDVGVLSGLVAMAGSLGLETVGEGIERADQLALLRSIGCGYAQGNLFSVPVPGEQFEPAVGAPQVSTKRGNPPLRPATVPRGDRGGHGSACHQRCAQASHNSCTCEFTRFQG